MEDGYCCERSAQGEMCNCPVIHPPVREEPGPCDGTGINIFDEECIFCQDEHLEPPPLFFYLPCFTVEQI